MIPVIRTYAAPAAQTPRSFQSENVIETVFGAFSPFAMRLATVG
jgi:hypothetical protein